MPIVKGDKDLENRADALFDIGMPDPPREEIQQASAGLRSQDANEIIGVAVGVGVVIALCLAILILGKRNLVMPVWGKRIVGFFLGWLAFSLFNLTITLALYVISDGAFVLRTMGVGGLLAIITGVVFAVKIPNWWPDEGLAKRLFGTESLSRLRLNLLDNSTKRIMGAIVFWVCSVGLFYLVFQPYGSSMNDNEFWLMVKIMLFPVGIGMAGFVGYVKLAASDEK